MRGRKAGFTTCAGRQRACGRAENDIGAEKQDFWLAQADATCEKTIFQVVSWYEKTVFGQGGLEMGLRWVLRAGVQFVSRMHLRRGRRASRLSAILFRPLCNHFHEVQFGPCAPGGGSVLLWPVFAHPCGVPHQTVGNTGLTKSTDLASQQSTPKDEAARPAEQLVEPRCPSGEGFRIGRLEAEWASGPTRYKSSAKLCQNPVLSWPKSNLRWDPGLIGLLCKQLAAQLVGISTKSDARDAAFPLFSLQ